MSNFSKINSFVQEVFHYKAHVVKIKNLRKLRQSFCILLLGSLVDFWWLIISLVKLLSVISKICDYFCIEVYYMFWSLNYGIKPQVWLMNVSDGPYLECVFFLSLLSCIPDDQLSSNFHNVVILCMLRYTKWENWSLTITDSVQCLQLW